MNKQSKLNSENSQIKVIDISNKITEKTKNEKQEEKNNENLPLSINHPSIKEYLNKILNDYKKENNLPKNYNFDNLEEIAKEFFETYFYEDRVVLIPDENTADYISGLLLHTKTAESFNIAYFVTYKLITKQYIGYALFPVSEKESAIDNVILPSEKMVHYLNYSQILSNLNNAINNGSIILINNTINK